MAKINSKQKTVFGTLNYSYQFPSISAMKLSILTIKALS